MRSVETAVVPVAGRGSRMRPLTTVTPKELFPLGRLPVIHRVVAELVAGGVSRIVLVNSPLKPSIDEYVERVLRPEVCDPGGAEIVFVAQGGVPGNGGAILSAVAHVGDGPLLVVWGDEVFTGPSRVRQLLDVWEATKAPVISAVEVSSDEVLRCGMILSSDEDTNLVRVDGIIEKPNPLEFESRLASVGGFVLDEDVLDELRATAIAMDGELYLSSALNSFAQRSRLLACKLAGRWFETGSYEGYSKAFVAIAKEERLV